NLNPRGFRDLPWKSAAYPLPVDTPPTSLMAGKPRVRATADATAPLTTHAGGGRSAEAADPPTVTPQTANMHRRRAPCCSDAARAGAAPRGALRCRVARGDVGSVAAPLRGDQRASLYRHDARTGSDSVGPRRVRSMSFWMRDADMGI